VSDLEEVQHVIRSGADEELLNLGRGMMAIHLVVRQMSLSSELFKIATADLMHNARSEPEDRASSQQSLIDAVQTLIDIARLFEQGLGGEEITAYNSYVLVTYPTSESDREALHVLAAMIACKIGLSAFDWVLQHLQPLRTDLPYTGIKRSALALVSRAFSLNKRFFLTERGEFSVRMAEVIRSSGGPCSLRNIEREGNWRCASFRWRCAFVSGTTDTTACPDLLACWLGFHDACWIGRGGEALPAMGSNALWV
jgi:hypothetical protein